jgi:hypothetical protein
MKVITKIEKMKTEKNKKTLKKWHKLLIWIPSTIIGIGIIAYLGLWGVYKIALSSNSCTFYNIDNIEVRTNIDIPSILDNPQCFRNKSPNTKTNYFRINIVDVNMDRYIERNSFVSVSDIDLDLSVFGKFEKTLEITSDDIQNFYYNSGKGKKTDWLAIIDKKSGDLWIYMEYKK